MEQETQPKTVGLTNNTSPLSTWRGIVGDFSNPEIRAILVAHHIKPNYFPIVTQYRAKRPSELEGSTFPTKGWHQRWSLSPVRAAV